MVVNDSAKRTRSKSKTADDRYCNLGTKYEATSNGQKKIYIVLLFIFISQAIELLLLFCGCDKMTCILMESKERDKLYLFFPSIYTQIASTFDICLTN